MIDVDVPQSPGWWLRRLAGKLLDRKRVARLDELAERIDGRPPLPVGAPNARKAYEAWQRKSVSNFEELIVEAVRERMRPIGIRTSVDGDDTGDTVAWRMWRRAGMPVTTADTLDLMLGLSEGYMMVGAPTEDAPTVPVVTAEDPRQVVTENDPAQPNRVLAALKMFHDDVADTDVAYLILPRDQGRGRESVTLFVATRGARQLAGWRMEFNDRTWSWDEDRGGADGEALPVSRVPVVRFLNKRGLAEFEPHVDVLDRIRQTILDRMVISTMQAFRQRAIKGLPQFYPQGHPKAGEEIDYEGIFVADPAAFWQLPESADVWESGQLDLTPILSAIKDDVQHASAVTRTPMYMFTPEGQNQSAEGASLAREGLVFKGEDRIERADTPLATVGSLCFEYMPEEIRFANGQDRADMDRLEIIWAPVERLSLIERAQAAAQAGDVPWRTKMRRIWGFAPHEVDEMSAERAADAVLAAMLTRQPAQPAAAVPAAGPQPAEQPASGAVA